MFCVFLLIVITHEVEEFSASPQFGRNTYLRRRAWNTEVLSTFFFTLLYSLRAAVFFVTARPWRTNNRLARKRWAWQRSLFDRGRLLLEGGCADRISWRTLAKRLEVETMVGVWSIFRRGDRIEVQISHAENRGEMGRFFVTTGRLATLQ